MPLLKKDGVDYYESQISTDVQMKTAERLSRLNQVYPLSYQQLSNFLANYMGEGETEGWLLFSFEKELRPSKWTPKLPSKIWTPGGMEPRYVRNGYTSQNYHAMVLVRAEDESPFGSAGNPDPCPKVSVYALCRDPWSDPYIVAHWVNLRLESLSGALGGALELEIHITETDVELQKALRTVGFLASHYEKDFDYLPVQADPEPPDHLGFSTKKKVERLSGREIGEIRFSKLLRMRKRSDLGKDFLSPRKNKKSSS